jgi:hypothetical protein
MLACGFIVYDTGSEDSCALMYSQAVMLVCSDMDEVIWDASLYRYDLYITIDWLVSLSQGRGSIISDIFPTS